MRERKRENKRGREYLALFWSVVDDDRVDELSRQFRGQRRAFLSSEPPPGPFPSRPFTPAPRILSAVCSVAPSVQLTTTIPSSLLTRTLLLLYTFPWLIPVHSSTVENVPKHQPFCLFRFGLQMKSFCHRILPST